MKKRKKRPKAGPKQKKPAGPAENKTLPYFRGEDLDFVQTVRFGGTEIVPLYHP